jgi:hypothetical protein
MRPTRPASAPAGQCLVGEYAAHLGGEPIHVGGIIEQQSVLLVGDLVLNPAHPAGNHRASLPHRLGDGESETLDQALLDHDGGVPLERVDDDGVLVAVVHRERGEMHPTTHFRRQAPPSFPALGEDLCALRVIAHPGHLQSGQHQMRLPDTMLVARADETCHHPCHVLQPVPTAYLHNKRRPQRGRVRLEEDAPGLPVSPHRPPCAIPAGEAHRSLRIAVRHQAHGGQDGRHLVSRERQVLCRERVDRWGDNDQLGVVGPLGGVGPSREDQTFGVPNVRAQELPAQVGVLVRLVAPHVTPPYDAGAQPAQSFGQPCGLGSWMSTMSPGETQRSSCSRFGLSAAR